MSYRVEKVRYMLTALEHCFNELEEHIFDIFEKHPNTSTNIKLLLFNALRDVERTSIGLEVVIDEINIDENNHIA